MGYDKNGTRVKVSKFSALGLAGGACELRESTQPLVRTVATFEMG